jgi:hypothetical protein
LGKADGKAFVEAAKTAQLDLKIVDAQNEDARNLYQILGKLTGVWLSIPIIRTTTVMPPAAH